MLVIPFSLGRQIISNAASETQANVVLTKRRGDLLQGADAARCSNGIQCIWPMGKPLHDQYQQ
jgi:hypothetical protein